MYILHLQKSEHPQFVFNFTSNIQLHFVEKKVPVLLIYLFAEFYILGKKKKKTFTMAKFYFLSKSMNQNLKFYLPPILPLTSSA